MREILGGTKKGKMLVESMLEEIKEEIKSDDYNDAMGDSLFEIDDLL
jgi:hypothetical protein